MHCPIKGECGSFYRTATNYLATVKPASTMHFLSLIIFITGRLISRSTGIVNRNVTSTNSESLSATIDGNSETRGKFHIIYKKVPETLKEHKLQRISYQLHTVEF